jgi:outer membrane murein-binding lipoprotein Lpp
VSTSLIAGMPQSVNQSSQPRSALGASSSLQAARMITARAQTRSDSIASSLTP